MRLPIQFGIDVFLQQAQQFNKKKLALLTNNAATNSIGLLSRVVLFQEGFNIVKLFSPEHGIQRTGADGVAQPNQVDHATGLPIISLYGTKRKPTLEDLQDIDAVIVDIPDVGCRFYTYLWTITQVMQACAQYQKQVIILDRPNPLGLDFSKAEGPFLDETHCASFIGRWSIPIRHSCTLGELALYFAASKLSPLDITVIPVANYHRYLRQDVSFTPTSPAIQNIATALLYPGMGLLEGINVNEGRGTPDPFCCFGAPWINKAALLQVWKYQQVPGVIAAAVNYTPQGGLYDGEACQGLQFTIDNRLLLQPVTMGIAVIKTLLQLYPDQLAERLYKTVANPSGTNHLDNLLGIPNAFGQLKAGEIIDVDVTPFWEQTMSDYLLY